MEKREQHQNMSDTEADNLLRGKKKRKKSKSREKSKSSKKSKSKRSQSATRKEKLPKEFF